MGNIFRKYERLQLKKKGLLKYRGRSVSGFSIMEQARRERDSERTKKESVKVNKPKKMTYQKKV